MKKIYLASCILLLTNAQVANSFSLLPQIEQIKSKVGAAATLPTTNLKELFDTSVVKKNADGTTTRILSREPVTFTELQILEKKFDDLYWCKQKEFYKELSNVKRNSIAASQHLQKKIHEKYPANQRPLMTFSADLLTEEKTLDELINNFFKKINDEPQNKTTIKEDLNKAIELKGTLEKLIDLVNDLLATV